MTQKELLGLVGLKATDPLVLAHFERYGLGQPPKNLASNNKVKIIEDKERNLSYIFSFDITNDHFYPPVDVGLKNPGHKFMAYLSEIGFLSKEPSIEKPDPKEASFWDLTLPPQASLEQVCQWYGPATGSFQKKLTFKKEIGPMLELEARYNEQKQAFAGNSVSIIEYDEIIGHYYIGKDPYFDFLAHLYAMLIKWLFDNRYLLIGEAINWDGLSANAQKVSDWIQRHLNGHLWDNQVTDTPHLRKFLFTVISNATVTGERGEEIDFSFINTLLRLFGQYEAYKKLNSGQRDQEKTMLRNIPFDENSYATFYAEMNRQFSYYGTLAEAR